MVRVSSAWRRAARAATLAFAPLKGLWDWIMGDQVPVIPIVVVSTATSAGLLLRVSAGTAHD